MILVLFRHGIAVDRLDPACPPDEERPLTAKGVRRTRRAARGLRALGVRPRVVLTSPLVRAVQTAELAMEELGVEPSVLARTDLLRPGAPAGGLLRHLKDRGVEEALCAGHAPNLDFVLAASLGIRGEPPFALKKAGAAAVDLVPLGGPGTLLWLLEPRALRTLGD